MIKIDETIFKAYDIRGIYPTQINEKTAFNIGRGFATFILSQNPQARNVVVGSDMRISSPALKKELMRGIIEIGFDVIDVGLVSTPTFEFAVAFYGYDGGIQVSASHNPKEHNGFKMVKNNALPISKNTGINEIKNIITEGKFLSTKTKGKTVIKKNVLQDLIKDQLKEIDISKIKKLKIAIDTANGMGALDMGDLFKKISADLVKINFDLDGSFPSHQADPLVEANLELLKKEVVKNKADLGISPDGDGDRYFFVDEKGNVIRQEILRGIMAQIELKEHPGAVVGYDIRPGRITKDMIDEAGGTSVVTPVGHSLIKEVMIANDAIFGGESSGHYFYKQPYGTFEMPIILVTKFLKFISEKNKPLSEIIKPYQKYFHSGEINFKVKDPKAKSEEIEMIYRDGKINKLDGVTVEYPDWWFNIRTSNTEPLVRLNLEARSKDLMTEKVKEISGIMEK